jgi:hypothetical protein
MMSPKERSGGIPIFENQPVFETQPSRKRGPRAASGGLEILPSGLMSNQEDSDPSFRWDDEIKPT